jgi:arylsulfatase A-like enzyme
MSTLQATGHADDTLVIVTADNGYHAGSHRMTTGKRTAFREDTVVPMVAIGPGVKAGARIDAMTSTIDLGPTFADVLGATTPTWVDGRSLTPLLASGTVPPTWRTGVLSENLGTSNPGDPDYEPGAPPTFTALRSQDWLYVKYDSGERELYDLRTDPWELDNIASTADPSVLAALDAQLTALSACSGDSCRVADAMTVPPPGAGL